MRDNSKGFAQVLVIILLLVLVGGGAYYFGVQKTKTDQKSVLKTPTPAASDVSEAELSNPNPTPTPNKTAGWQTYSGTDFVYENPTFKGYSFLFPPTCDQTMAALTCKFSGGSGTIIVNAGGHGGENIETKVIKNNETKVYPAGEGKLTLIEDVKTKTVFGTFWINKTNQFDQEPIFGFEFMKIPVSDLSEFEEMFDQMMFTFKFTY
jgi:hypothetical protein